MVGVPCICSPWIRWSLLSFLALSFQDSEIGEKRCIFTAYELSVVVGQSINGIAKSLDNFLGVRSMVLQEGCQVVGLPKSGRVMAPAPPTTTEVTSSRLITGSVHPPVTQVAFHILFAGTAATAGITGAQAASGIAGTGSAKERGQEESVQRATPAWE